MDTHDFKHFLDILTIVLLGSIFGLMGGIIGLLFLVFFEFFEELVFVSFIDVGYFPDIEGRTFTFYGSGFYLRSIEKPNL